MGINALNAKTNIQVLLKVLFWDNEVHIWYNTILILSIKF